MKTLTRLIFAALALLWLTATCLAQLHSREIDLNFAPAKTNIDFTLGDILHTVHGSFNLKRGTVHFDPATNTIRGEILVDAASGHSGSDGRDKRMQNEVLESSHYPDIVFQPDHVEGRVADMGVSTIQVHGIFSIHGAAHEITIPVQVEMAPGQWTATSHFAVPYVAWGMKNPSTFVLRVSQSVDIEIRATGEMP
ncbi:MAG: YceI family protein [Terriglobales bacterium]